LVAGGGDSVVGFQELTFWISRGSCCDFRVVGEIAVVVFRERKLLLWCRPGDDDRDVSTAMRCSTISLNCTTRFGDVLFMLDVVMVVLAPVHENWDPWISNSEILGFLRHDLLSTVLEVTD
jgi:hypothetical protein